MEARAVRRFVSSGVHVVESGVALRGQSDVAGDLAISCGLAGGLRPDLPTGTVLVPERVLRPDGSEMQCDEPAVNALTNAALQFGHRVVRDPLVTSHTFVYGEERAIWAARGYAGVDMETGLLRGSRIACVRVILDTPKREISPAWLQPARAILQPRAWRDLPFLMREGPRCSAVAAQIAAAAAKRLLVAYGSDHE